MNLGDNQNNKNVNNQNIVNSDNQSQYNYNGQQYQYNNQQYQYNGQQQVQYNQNEQNINIQKPLPTRSQSNKSVEAPVTGWNWGAMMYSWIWGLANGTYLPLLTLIPIFNLFWIFVCGAKGNEWALESGTWKTTEEFNAVQKSWNKAGKITFYIMLAYIAICIIMGILNVALALIGAVGGAIFN